MCGEDVRIPAGKFSAIGSPHVCGEDCGSGSRKTSRDIYDVWFFLNHRFPINKTIIEKRGKMPFNELIQQCIEKLEKMSNRKIMDGIVELLTSSQKGWAGAKLREETIDLLRLRIEK